MMNIGRRASLTSLLFLFGACGGDADPVGTDDGAVDGAGQEAANEMGGSDGGSGADGVDAASDGGAADAADGAVPEGGGVEAGGCRKRWTVTETGLAKVTVAAGGGVLAIGASGASSGISVHVTQGDLSGDFEAEARFGEWFPGASGVYGQLAVRPVGDDVQYAAARVITTDPAGSQVSAIVKTDTTSAPYKVANKKGENAGRMWIKRTAGSISIEVATGPSPDKSPVTKVTNAHAFPTGPVVIGFEHGANMKLLGGGSIEYSDFRLTGGGLDDASDDFACDSLE